MKNVPLFSSSLASFALTAIVACSSHDGERATVPQDEAGPSSGGSPSGPEGGSQTNDAGPGEPDAADAGVREEAAAPQPDASADGADATSGPVTLGGSLRVGSTLFVDSDHADPRNALSDNDSAETAQTIANPSTTGGYIGRPRNFEDPIDVYRVQLAAEQTVTLYIGEPTDNADIPDLDLFLFDDTLTSDPDAEPVESSEGVGPVELVEVPASGGGGSRTYYAVVRGYEGAEGLYTLAVGEAVSAATISVAAQYRMSSLYPMVEGEALIKMRKGAQATASNLSRSLGVRVLGGGKNRVGYVRVALPPPNGSKKLGAASGHTRATTIASIKTILGHTDVEFAEPNYLREPHAAAPNDPLYKNQWHYPLINLLEAWDQSTGTDAIVAVLDTGVVLSHPDFRNSGSSQLIDGYDMIANATRAGDGDGRDDDPDDPGDLRFPNDSSWHGTHCAGTVAAATNNGKGCAGVAPSAKVMPVRVLGRGGGTNDDIVQGVLYAAGLDNDTGETPERRADVISMSLGGPGLSRTMAAAVDEARNAGVIVVASSGNSAEDASFISPAGETGVVTVGAIDIQKRRTVYSNYGSVLDVVAPGGDETRDRNFDGLPDGVMSLVYANGGATLYTPYQGTSMACPHVAGIAALMKSVYPAMTASDFDDFLAGAGASESIAEDLGAAGRDDDYGYGLLNANLAVLAAREAASGPVADTPALSLSTTSLDFGSDVDELTLKLTNAGTGTLSITSIQPSESWITVEPGTVGENTVTIDRSSLSAGIYSESIEVVSNGGSRTVRIRVSVGQSEIVGGNIGVVYVLLIEPDSFDTVAQAIATPEDDYAFTLPDVEPGEYRLVAGTDLDDNGIIDDDGEAFGGFPISSDPALLKVAAVRNDLDFAVQFQLNLGADATAVTPEAKPARHYRRIW